MKNKTIEKLDKEIEELEHDLTMTQSGYIKERIEQRLQWKRRQHELLIQYHAR